MKLLALTRSDDRELVLVNMANALTVEPSFGTAVIRFNADRENRNLIKVKETIEEIEARLPEGWTVFTRSRDKELILVNMANCVSVEPSYSSTVVRFDADGESRNYITVKETVEEIVTRTED